MPEISDSESVPLETKASNRAKTIAEVAMANPGGGATGSRTGMAVSYPPDNASPKAQRLSATIP
jgi:hypothetical protein